MIAANSTTTTTTNAGQLQFSWFIEQISFSFYFAFFQLAFIIIAVVYVVVLVVVVILIVDRFFHSVKFISIKSFHCWGFFLFAARRCNDDRGANFFKWKSNLKGFPAFICVFFPFCNLLGLISFSGEKYSFIDRAKYVCVFLWWKMRNSNRDLTINWCRIFTW